MFSNSSQASQFLAVNNGFTETSQCCAAVLVQHAGHRAGGQLCLSVGRSVGPIKHLGAVLQFWCDMLGTELEGSCACRSVGRSDETSRCCAAVLVRHAGHRAGGQLYLSVGRSVGPIKHLSAVLQF